MAKSIGQLLEIGLLAFFATIGFDLLLHAGILDPLYSNNNSFLLSPEDALRRIPLGYLSVAIFTTLMLWVMLRIRIQDGGEVSYSV